MNSSIIVCFVERYYKFLKFIEYWLIFNIFYTILGCTSGDTSHSVQNGRRNNREIRRRIKNWAEKVAKRGTYSSDFLRKPQKIDLLCRCQSLTLLIQNAEPLRPEIVFQSCFFEIMYHGLQTPIESFFVMYPKYFGRLVRSAE